MDNRLYEILKRKRWAVVCEESLISKVQFMHSSSIHWDWDGDGKSILRRFLIQVGYYKLALFVVW